MSPPPILFDLDGTLIDSIELLLQSMHHAFAERSELRPTTREWIAGIGTPLAAQFRPMPPMTPTSSSSSTDTGAIRWPTTTRLTRCYAGILDIVRGLSDRGHPLAVVTSKGNELANRSIAHVGLAPYFRKSSVSNAPPATNRPGPRLICPCATDASTDGAFFVGDSPHDIAAGNAAGVSTVAAFWGAFSRGTRSSSARPRYLMDRIEGLDALLRGAARNRPRNDRVDRRCRPPAAAHARRRQIT